MMVVGGWMWMGVVGGGWWGVVGLVGLGGWGIGDRGLGMGDGGGSFFFFFFFFFFFARYCEEVDHVLFDNF